VFPLTVARVGAGARMLRVPAESISEIPLSWNKRVFDVVLACVLLPLALPLLVVLAILIRTTSRGPALHWSNRVGRDNRIFRMPKFRSMRIDAPELPTHLLPNPERYLTPIGCLLRKASLDELPQLFSILTGDLSFAGPRPALFNQDDLIELRTKQGIHRLVPGLTGWAQVNGRDDLPIPEKVRFDYEYLQRRCFAFDLKILCATVLTVLRGEGIRH
jgi:O-antigen biosynthesis protein WbqP